VPTPIAAVARPSQILCWTVFTPSTYTIRGVRQP
jgi:hypothetical protein